MYNIIPLILILISLGVIIVIAVKKFSLLANLDVANMPAEREAKFKERIISNRLKRTFFKWWSKLLKLLSPLAVATGNFFSRSLERLTKLKEEYKKSPLPVDDLEQKLNQLFNEAAELKKQNDFVKVEKKYIEIIGLDSKNIRVFKELGRLYFEEKNYEEAKQTFEHLLKLKQDDEEIYDNLAQIAKAEGDLKQAKKEYLKFLEINKQSAQTYFNLALVYQAMGKMKLAVNNLKQALAIEPSQPRYLDTMLEISIMIKDKAMALDSYKKLLEVNPENQKLEEFKKQIDAL